MIGQVLLEQFRVEMFIAAGGMGSVYKVWDLKRSTWLAMKALHAEFADDPDSFRRFQREANALKKLAHPNIVPFYGLFRTDDFAFLLQRYIDGPSLGSVLKERKGVPLPLEEALIYLRAISSALGYAHHNNVVHCDVKPGNVLMDAGGSIYLTDFGIARHADSTTTTFAAAGTPAYMSPEQVRGEALTPASDVYSLAVMAFEMLTGRRPFRGDGDTPGSAASGATAAERIRAAHLSQPPPDPRSLNPQIEPALAAILLRGLEKVPARRPVSAPAFFEALSAAAGIQPGSVPDRARVGATQSFPVGARPVSEPATPPRRKPAALWWVAAAGLVLLLGAAALMMTAGRNRPAAMPAQTTPAPVEAGAAATATLVKAATATLRSLTATPTLAPTADGRSSTATPAAQAAVPTLPPPPRYDLAFASNKNGQLGVFLMNSKDPSDWVELPSPVGFTRIWHPTFCGDQVAVEAVSEDRAFPDWIFLIDPANGGITQFEPPGGAAEVVAAPRCAPHGTLLAYSANKQDAWYVMVANLARGKKAFQMRGENYAQVGYVSWSFAEDAFYWMGVSEDFRSFFIRRTGDLSSESGQTSPVVNGKYPALSPDGNYLADVAPDRLNLVVMNVQSGTQVFSQNIRYEDLGGKSMPATAMWSGDGQWLYYASSQDGDWDIYRISRDGKSIENVTEDWKTDELTPAVHW